MAILERVRHGMRPFRNIRQWWGYRWNLAVLSSLCLTITFGVVYSFSVFYTPLQNAFQVSTENVSLLFSGNVFLLYAVGMAGGFLADRYRPRRLLAVATLCWGGGIIGTATADTYVAIVVLYGVVGAVGCGTCYVTVYATVVRWFDERRGMAMGVLSVGFGLGTLVFPPLSQALIAWFSWRTAYLSFGVLSLAVMIPTTLVVRSPSFENGARSASTEEPLSVIESVMSVRFWLVAGGYMLGFYTFYTFLVHLVPYASSLGISSTAASTAIGLIGGASMVSRFGGAYLSDHVGRVPVLTVSFLMLSACSLGILLLVSDAVSLLAVTLLFGLGYGSTASLYSPMIADIFGTASVGRMLGLTGMSFGVAGLTGPYITSRLFATTGTYEIPFLIASAAPVAGILCIILSARVVGPTTVL